MSVQTVNGATLPAGPAPGTGGVRAYDESDLAGSVGDERERVREDGLGTRLGEVTREGVDNARDADGVRDTLRQQMDLVSAILTVVIAGAVAYAGLNVMSSMAGSMSLSEGDMFYNASVSLENGIESFFTNMPTVFVVIALVLIIGYLTILRR
jgi:hypothetical protein